VPALDARPVIPLWLVPALDAYTDLGGHASWWRVREWSEYHGINFEWLLPVLRYASAAVDEHFENLRKQKRATTPGDSADTRP